jgi:hypothetical protein
MDDKVNLAAKLASFDGAFAPKIVAYLNDYKDQVLGVTASAANA